MDNNKDRLEYLNDLKALRKNAHFIRIMSRNNDAINHLHRMLMCANPKDDTLIAGLQAKLDVVINWKTDYETCENLIFKLESDKKSGINRNHDNGLVPPTKG